VSVPAKATYIAKYDDGSEKITVSFDMTSERLPNSVSIEMGSNWLYVDVADIPQLRAFLECARKAILANIAVEQAERGGA
jgi:hypothetical protein